MLQADGSLVLNSLDEAATALPQLQSLTLSRLPSKHYDRARKKQMLRVSACVEALVVVCLCLSSSCPALPFGFRLFLLCCCSVLRVFGWYRLLCGLPAQIAALSPQLTRFKVFSHSTAMSEVADQLGREEGRWLQVLHDGGGWNPLHF